MKLKFLSALCGAGMALASLSLQAELPAPVGGVITIPDGTEVTVSTSAEAAMLAAATGIVLGDGATLAYTCADALALSAKVSGRGTFSATGAGTVTLSGDNSGLFNPGHFEFTNTKVVDSNFNGLGGAESGAAVFAKSSSMTVEDLSFTMADGVFTNNAPLKITVGSVRFGVANCTFVQNADLTMSGSGENHLYTSGAFEMISGTLTINGHPRLHASSAAPISFLGTSVCRFNNACILYGAGISFGGASVSGGIAASTDNNCYFLKDACLGVSCILAPYPNGNSGIFYNLNGTSQEVGRVEHGNGGWENYSCGFYTASDKPASIKAISPNGNTKTVNFRMDGPISYWHDTPQNLTFINKKPAATGSLTVSKGSVTFSQGSGWSGKYVTVGDGGALVFNSTSSLTSGKHRLVVEAGGSLTVAEDVLISVGTATFNGRQLDPNTTYTMDEVREFLGEDPGVTLLGDGSIKTGPKSIPGTWEGWPEVGTATKATIPDNAAAVITDADVDRVEALSEIESGAETTISITTSSRILNLRAKVSGAVQITAEKAAKVVIWSDNSGLVYPGAFKFVDTQSVISNEYGLGGAQTGTAVFSFENSISAADIVFGCPSGYFTNNVAVRLLKGREKTSYFGAAKEGDWFFQNADLSVETTGNCHNHYMTYNTEQIAGRMTANIGTYLHHFGKGTWGFFGTSDIALASQCLVYDSNLIVDCAQWTATYGVMPTANVQMKLMHDNVFSSTTCIRPYANGLGETPMIDFNGTTQVVASLRCNSYNKGNMFALSSATPALLKATSASLTGSEEMGCYVGGQLSYWHDTPYNITFGVGRSNTKGDLIISKGSVGFTAAAAWLGPKIAVGGTGRLVIGAASQAGVLGTTRKNATNLHISDSGKVQIDATTFTPFVHNVYVNNRPVAPGTYTKDTADWIEGEGSLKVFGTPGLALLLK